MKINNECTFMNSSQIKIIENGYDAKYIYESELYHHEKDCWSNTLGAIFYQSNLKDVSHSHWFAYFKRGDKFFITSAERTIKHQILAIEYDGKYFYSHYTHDFISTPIGFIDGGRQYTRIGGPIIPIIYKFSVTKDGLILEQ
jgi:hypothetical protein